MVGSGVSVAKMVDGAIGEIGGWMMLAVCLVMLSALDGR
jgi:hypothetical protein